MSDYLKSDKVKNRWEDMRSKFKVKEEPKENKTEYPGILKRLWGGRTAAETATDEIKKLKEKRGQ